VIEKGSDIMPTLYPRQGDEVIIQEIIVRVNFEKPLRKGFDPFTTSVIFLRTESGQNIEIDLSAAQLAATLTTLGIQFDEDGYCAYDDWDLGEMNPDWVNVSKAAALLHLTKGRVYSIIKAGGLETRNDTGEVLVNIDSINERLANPPKSGRRW
ncbi:MAG: hypothetical protein RR547_13735, partial [Raoultibacter sp.]